MSDIVGSGGNYQTQRDKIQQKNNQTSAPNDRRTSIEALINISRKIFNEQLKLTYDGRVNRSQEEVDRDKQLKDILLVGDRDTVPEVTLKLLTFYLLGNKIPSVIEEYIAVNKKYVNKDPDMVWGKLCVKGKGIIGDRAKSAYKYIQIKNIDRDKITLLSSFNFKIGSVLIMYTLKDGSQIKLNCSTQKEGHKAINELLKVIKVDLLQGTSEEHSYIGTVPSDSGKLKLDGLTLEAISLQLHDRNGLIPNGKILF